MCDFAHDPEEVRKLLVGRVLTVNSSIASKFMAVPGPATE